MEFRIVDADELASCFAIALKIGVEGNVEAMRKKTGEFLVMEMLKLALSTTKALLTLGRRKKGRMSKP